jgi:hypothetical protein
VTRAAEIVTAMHQDGVAHRDLHPGNWRIVGNDVNTLKPIDFSEAGPLNAFTNAKDLGDLGRLLQYLTTTGTPTYAAMPDAWRRTNGRMVSLAEIARRAIDGEFATVRQFHQALAPFTAPR